MICYYPKRVITDDTCISHNHVFLIQKRVSDLHKFSEQTVNDGRHAFVTLSFYNQVSATIGTVKIFCINIYYGNGVNFHMF